MILCLVMWHVVYTPLNAAFMQHASSGMDWFIDFIFFLDLLLNFNTAYVDKFGHLVTSRAAIARHYAGTHFFSDLLGVIPLELFLAGQPNAHLGSLLRLCRVVRLHWRVSQLFEVCNTACTQHALAYTCMPHTYHA